MSTSGLEEQVTEKKPLECFVGGIPVGRGETVVLKNIEGRLRDAGLAVLTHDEMSKKARKALYRDREATFALYGEPDYVVASYSREIDPEITQLMEEYTNNRVENAIHDGKGSKDVEGIILEMNNDLAFLQAKSYTWFENPDRLLIIDGNLPQDLKDNMLLMDRVLHEPKRKSLEEKYGFTLKPEVLDQVSVSEDNKRKRYELTMRDHLAE